MLLPRVLTALLGAPLFLWVVYLGGLPFFFLVFFLVLLTLMEFQKMAEHGGYATQSHWGIGVGAMVVLALAFPGLKSSEPFRLQAPAFAIVAGVFLLLIREMARVDKSLSLLRVATSLTALFVVAWPLTHLILLRELRGPEGYHPLLGRNVLFLLIGSIWAQDTAAWGVGKTLGKNRLAPAVSPGKTWEGAVGGFVACVLVVWLCREILLKDFMGRPEAVLLGAAISVLAQLSDLLESLLKRCFGVKDSSHLLPGHGGFLDRFDSFLFTAPFLYFYLVSFGRAQ